MKNKKLNKSLKFTGLFTFCSGLFIVVITPYFDNINDVSPLFSLGILIAFLLAFLSVYKILGDYHHDHEEMLHKDFTHEVNRLSVSSKQEVYAGTNNKFVCPKTGLLCSATVVMDNEYYGRLISCLELSKTDCEHYNLVTADEFDRLESAFFNTHPDGEIWIVSYALETEIKTKEELENCPDESLENSMEVVKTNIQNGGKYTQFVSLGPQGEHDVTYENRCKIYWSALPNLTEEEKKQKMPIIRIDDSFSHLPQGRMREADPDFEYLVKLTSTVLFVDDREDRLFVEGYFFLRPDDRADAKQYERRTVFFKMPECMKDDYYYFLRDKKMEYDESIKN